MNAIENRKKALKLSIMLKRSMIITTLLIILCVVLIIVVIVNPTYYSELALIMTSCVTIVYVCIDKMRYRRLIGE